MSKRSSSSDRSSRGETTPPAPPSGVKTKPGEVHGPQSALAVMREWMDALAVAFVLAMFIRVFLVELFKIPSGSMTPTLIGGLVATIDHDRDGKKDLLLFRDAYDTQPLLFLNNGQRLIAQGFVNMPGSEVKKYERYDRILVNKLAYWFHQPRRGDIIVFKVPDRIWEPSKPIYIKRCVGEAGDRLTFDPQGRLVANGRLVTKPDFFQTQSYDLTVTPHAKGFFEMPEIKYRIKDSIGLTIQSIQAPKDEIYVFGDNTNSSLDGRYWGGVPRNNVKGRAFFRYYPLDQWRIFHGG